MIAWLIPNTKDATSKRLDQYLVSIEELERRTGEVLPEVPAFLRSERPEASWLIPQGAEGNRPSRSNQGHAELGTTPDAPDGPIGHSPGGIVPSRCLALT